MENVAHKDSGHYYCHGSYKNGSTFTRESVVCVIGINLTR